MWSYSRRKLHLTPKNFILKLREPRYRNFYFYLAHCLTLTETKSYPLAVATVRDFTTVKH